MAVTRALVAGWWHWHGRPLSLKYRDRAEGVDKLAGAGAAGVAKCPISDTVQGSFKDNLGCGRQSEHQALSVGPACRPGSLGLAVALVPD